MPLIYYYNKIIYYSTIKKISLNNKFFKQINMIYFPYNNINKVMDLKDTVEKLKTEYTDNHFTKFLKNKSVIIVGPDTNLKGKGLGSKIDSYDVVIRHNTVWEYLPFKPGFAKDYGTKTSVLYFAPQCFKDYAKKSETIKKLKLLNAKHGLRFICYQNGNKDGGYFLGPHYFLTEVDWFKKYCRQVGIKTHYSHHTTRDLVNLMVNKNNGENTIPRTGFISVFDMYVHLPKSVKIIGMSFYHGGGHAFRKKCMEVLDPKLNAYGKTSGTHNSEIEIEIFKELSKVYPDLIDCDIVKNDNKQPKKPSEDDLSVDYD
tara:strand:- start:3965 stop:4909 length:945 start_codon:yes stop_codon:yes gene_type:complete